MDCWVIQAFTAMPDTTARLPLVLAYVDPGTGSLVFQILVAGLLTSMLMLRRLPGRIVAWMTRLVGRTT